MIIIGIQESFQVLIAELKKQQRGTFKDLCNEAGYSNKSVYNMLSRQSLRCDVLEELLEAAGYRLAILPKEVEMVVSDKVIDAVDHKSTIKLNDGKEKALEKFLDTAGYKMAIVSKEEEKSPFENVLKAAGCKLAIVPNDESREEL